MSPSCGAFRYNITEVDQANVWLGDAGHESLALNTTVTSFIESVTNDMTMDHKYWLIDIAEMII